MWTNRSFDELPTLHDYVESEGLGPLFEGSQIDAATQQNIYMWFYSRKLCIDDFKEFERYFKVALLRCQSQYLGYLRVETTQFDPMVQKYMERLIEGLGTTANTTDVTATGGGSSTTETDVTTGDKTTKTDVISSTTTTDEKTSQKTSNEHNDVTTASGKTESTRNGTGTTTVSARTLEVSDSSVKALRGELPRSTTYGNGIPARLDWTMTTTQDESFTDNSTNTTTDSETDVTSRDTQDIETNDRTSVVGDYTTTVTGTRDNAVQETARNTSETEKDGTGFTKAVTTNTNNTTQGTTAEGKNTSETKERYAGRDEAPQDLLDRARNYILKTNAFDWLTSKLEVAFMSTFEW